MPPPNYVFKRTARKYRYRPEHSFAAARPLNTALGDNMRGFHAGALICFGIALVFYFLSWLPGAWGLAFFGVCFEVAAWVQVLVASHESTREP